MVTPCSVNAYGLDVLGRFAGDVITDCDNIVSHSSEVNLNMKSSGKLSNGECYSTSYELSSTVSGIGTGTGL
jgi:hypothetical protein